jgi:peroxiredoxin
VTAGGGLLALAPGAAFPDLDLPDHNGAPRRLSELVGGDPTVVQFFRGWWCPKEQAYFRRLVALQDELEVAYAGLVSISVDAPLVQSAFRAGIGARWTFLSDEARTWQERLGLREVTDTVNDPYLPVVCVVSPGLRIHSAYNGYWFWGRPTNEELRRDLRAASQALRPDWNPPAAPDASPGSRA